MPRPFITVVETQQFMRQADDVWSESEREAFIDFIARNPESGDVIPDTGGIRKVRWSRGRTGKRGGVRVIYFYHNAGVPIYLLMTYAKARRENLTPDEKRILKRLAAALKASS